MILYPLRQCLGTRLRQVGSNDKSESQGPCSTHRRMEAFQHLAGGVVAMDAALPVLPFVSSPGTHIFLTHMHCMHTSHLPLYLSLAEAQLPT